MLLLFHQTLRIMCKGLRMSKMCLNLFSIDKNPAGRFCYVMAKYACQIG